MAGKALVAAASAAPKGPAAAFHKALVEAERISHTLMVPAMYNLCLLSGAMARHDLSSWRVGGYGGAPMPVDGAAPPKWTDAAVITSR